MPRQSEGITRQHQINYGNLCQVSQCNHPRLPNHRYCQKHKSYLLYRGDPHQTIVSPRSINFSRKTVKLLVIENQSNPSWNELMEAFHERWEASKLYIHDELKKFRTGKQVLARGTRHGYEMCSDIFQNLGIDQALEIWAAFQYLQEDSPYLFITDESFKHQVIKYMRAKAKSHHSQMIDKRTGKHRNYSSVLYMIERDTAWEIILRIFGAIGLRLHQQLKKRADRLIANKEKIDRAIRNIT